MDDLSVLLVDDNPTFQQVINQFIGKTEGLSLKGWAKNGTEAIEMARSDHPEMVLLDLGMPDISGLEVLPILRSLLPQAIIVVLTLMEADSYEQASLQAGADGFVCKSRLNSDLLPTVQGLIANRAPGNGEYD